MKRYLVVLAGVFCSITIAAENDLGASNSWLSGGGKKTIVQVEYENMDDDSDTEESPDKKVVSKVDSTHYADDPNHDTSRNGYMQYG